MKILFVTTVSGTVNAFLIPHIKMLLELGHHVDLACKVQKEIDSSLVNNGCKVYDINFTRFPFSKNNLFAYMKMKQIIYDGNYDLVHTHTPVASFCVRLACRKLANKKVFYTAHGFHFFKGAPIINWLVYYPTEKWLSRYTDVIITINNEDYQIAKRSFGSEKVEYIPGIGLDTKKFSEVTVDKLAKREELNLPKDAFVVLSVGELNKNKNHETVIKALAKINIPNLYYVICGQGSFKDYLRKLAKKLGLEQQVIMLGHREDVAEIYKAADVFAFPSKREGLPVSLMEALASGLPVVCSNIRGNKDLVEDGKGGYLIEPNNYVGFAQAINKIAQGKEIQMSMKQHNIKLFERFDFDIDTVKNRMFDIYNKDM